MATVPSGDTMRVDITCAPLITSCSKPTGTAMRIACFRCAGSNFRCSPRRSFSSGDCASRKYSIKSAVTARASAVPSAAPSTPRFAPGRWTPSTVLPGKIKSRLNTTSSAHIRMCSMLGTRMLPLDCSMPPARLQSCMAGSESANTRKYQEAFGQISGVPPSQWGSAPLAAAPISASSSEKPVATTKDCIMMLRAVFIRFAPMNCATSTVKPVAAAEHTPPSSHVLEDTSPMEAESAAPS